MKRPLRYRGREFALYGLLSLRLNQLKRSGASG